MVDKSQANGCHDEDKHDCGVVMESHDADRGQDDEEGGKRVTSMVEELPHGSVGVGTTSLLAVDSVHRLVDEEAQGTQQIRPTRGLK